MKIKKIISILLAACSLQLVARETLANDGDIYCQDFETAPSGYYTENYSSKISVGYKSVGGRDNNSLVFTANNASMSDYTNTSSRWTGYGAYSQYSANHSISSDETYSVLFYNASNGRARMRVRVNAGTGAQYNIDVFESDSTGATTVPASIKETDRKSIGTLSTSTWHEAALCAHYSTNTFEVLIDGTSVSTYTYNFKSTTQTIGYIALNALPNTTSSTLNGVIAYDRLRMYSGTYKSERVTRDFSDVTFAGDEGNVSASINTTTNDSNDAIMLAYAQFDNNRLIALSTDTSAGGKETLTAINPEPSSASVKNRIMVLDATTLQPLSNGYSVGNKTLGSADFEDDNYQAQMYFNKNSNTFETALEDSNTVYHIKSVNTSPLHIEENSFAANSDVTFYTVKFKNVSTATRADIHFKDSNAKFQSVILVNGTKAQFGTTFTEKSIDINLNQWYTYTIRVDNVTRKITVYVDGIEQCTFSMSSEFCTNGGVNQVFRIQPTTGIVDQEFYLDDMYIYEGLVPRTDIGEISHVIDLTNTSTVYESDAPERIALSGYKTIHVRDSLAYDGTTKTFLTHEVKSEDDGYYVYASDVDKALGLSSGLGNTYVKIDTYAAKTGKTMTEVDSEYNDGLFVLGDTAFDTSSYSDDDLQDLNDFTFYRRPTIADVQKLYNSSDNKGVHPRIMATADDFAALKQKVSVEGSKEAYWYSIIQNNLEGFLESDPIPYFFKDGSQMLDVSRAKMGILQMLGVAYYLEDDEDQKARIVNRAWLEMKSACDFDNWYPQAHLNPCEFAVAMSMGYDWFYNALTADQRKYIEQAMYEKFFYYIWLGYTSSLSVMSNFATVTANHNTVCNGSTVLASLAFADAYPDVCSYTLSNAIRGFEIPMYNWAPNGAWFEGLNYWDYAMQYTVKCLSSMETALGTNLGFDKCEGLSQSSNYLVYFQAPSEGSFNYGDCQSKNIWSPELLWLSNKYDSPASVNAFVKYFWIRGTYDFNGNSDVADPSTCLMYESYNLEDLTLAMLWLDPSVDTTTDNYTLDKFYANEDSMTMRNSWGTNPTFVGMHAGITTLPHSQLDGGSFAFYDGGVRWSDDPGMGNYSSENYWDSSVNGTRWKHFQCRAEAHSTIIVNPDANPDHNPDSYAKMNVVKTDDNGGIVTVDMSEVLSKNVDSATRGFYYTDNRRSLVIRDELSLTNDNSVIDWNMCTASNATLTKISDTSYRLKSGYKYLYIDFATAADVEEVVLENEAPLPTSPVMSDDTTCSLKRFRIKLKASGDTSITVKLTPSAVYSSATQVSEYNKPISTWK